MMVRKSTINDLNLILDIYSNAISFMRKNGNIFQWNDFDKLKEDIIFDIEKRHHHIIYDENKIYGCFTFFIGEDPTYKIIDNGSWLNNDLYGVIHKVASTFETKGLLNNILSYVERKVSNIRIDTHKDNYPMQQALEKNDFKKCGIIYLKDGSERLAYQRTNI